MRTYRHHGTEVCIPCIYCIEKSEGMILKGAYLECYRDIRYVLLRAKLVAPRDIFVSEPLDCKYSLPSSV